MTPESTGPPEQRPAVRNVAWLFAGLMPLLSIMWGLQLPSRMGVALFREQMLAVMLGLTLAVIFLTMRANRKKGGRLPWYDGCLAFLSLATLFYVAFDYRRFQIEFPHAPAEMVIIGTLILVLVMEALRRATGYVLFTIVGVFLGYSLVGHLVPAPLTGRYNNLESLLIYFGFDANATLGTPMSVATTIVILFIFFGQLLVKTGGGEFFLDIAMALMGRRRGGAAKISVLSSALFGSISGSAVSNVATTGIMTIPLMKRSGYSAAQAGAIESIASTGGQFMPPIMGAAAFLMAEFLEIAYSEVVIAGLIPALLYYFAVFVQVDLVAGRDEIKVVQKDLPRAGAVLKEGWHFIVPFLVLIFALFQFNLEAEIAALYAALTIVIGGSLRTYKGQRLDLRKVFSTFWDTGLTMVELVIIVAAAGVVIGILNITSGGFVLTLFLIQLGGGSLVVLLALAGGVCILLGMGMPTSGVYVLLAALVAPALVEAGIQPLAAHLFILYFGMMSMITPPIALAAYAAATISRADPMRTGFEAMSMGWVAYVVPFLFVLSPTLILNGERLHILLNTTTAVIGVYLVSVAVVGYFSRRLSIVHRLVLTAAGLAAMYPDTSLDLAGVVSGPGAILGVLLLGRDYLASRRPGVSISRSDPS
ncbi:MAG: TRAP transporter fused permease subunit [bacterium]